MAYFVIINLCSRMAVQKMMKADKILFRIMIMAAIVILAASRLSAQQDVKSPAGNDSATTAKSESKHSLFATTGFGYNMIYMGTSLSQDKPYYSGGLIYGFKNELFLSVSAFHLNAYDPFISFSTFALIYTHTFNSWFDISLSASRYQVNKILADTLFTSFLYGDLTLGFDWKLLYTKVSAGGLFSEASGVYFQMRNSRFFETPQFFNDKANFSFDPYVNLLFGTLTETKDGTMVVTPPFGKGKSGRGSSTETTSKFSLMEIDLGLPVSFNIGKFTIDAEPGYAIPLYSEPSALNTTGFVFTMGIYFKIF
jgi:hypothetical protein